MATQFLKIVPATSVISWATSGDPGDKVLIINESTKTIRWDSPIPAPGDYQLVQDDVTNVISWTPLA